MKLQRTFPMAMVAILACASMARAQSQSWDKQLTAMRRFVVLTAFAGEAVLDKETGLVWERTPADATPDGVLNDLDLRNWFQAHQRCRTLTTGNRRGWRLPTFEELASLLDPNAPAADLELPVDHPFGVDGFGPPFWSASTNAFDSALARRIDFKNGNSPLEPKLEGRGFIWCVRGGQGVDPQ